MFEFTETIWQQGEKEGNRRFVQSIIRARLHDDSRRMIRAITGMIRTLELLIHASKLLGCLIYFFQIAIKITLFIYQLTMRALFVDFVNLYIIL